MMSEPRDRASLAWQAFCYVAGELSPAEHEAFEASLAEDQQAREAVAEAVELVHVIAAAESQLAQPAVAAVCSARLWRSRIGWVLVGGVASLLFAWLSLGPLETNWRGQRSGLDRPRELAAAWVQTRRALATTGESEGWLPGADLAFDAEDGLWLHEWQGEELMEDEIAETPSWMVAAVVHAGDLAGESGAANPSRVPTRAEN